MLVLAATPLAGGAAAVRLVAACLTRIAQVNDCSRSPVLVPFVVGNERVGAVPPAVVEALRSWPAVFECSDPSRVSLSPELAEATLEQRSCGRHCLHGSVAHTNGQCSVEPYTHVPREGPAEMR